MAVILEDRPIEKVREEVIDTLIYNYSHGIISDKAFERRLDHAMASTNHQEIVDLAKDLEKPKDEKFSAQKERQFNVNYAAANNNETDTIVNILGGSCRSGQWTVPQEIRIITLFGGADIDFTDAIFTTPNVTIKVLCLFGGTDIKVPEDINIISKAFCILGGIDNTAPSIASKQAPTLTIEGLVMFGGLDIKIKRTIKEKFVAFANQMKTMFNNEQR
ncbi:cell wall-active antibiotics response protein [Paraglaciecola aquimarina]|uniref:Cell wall-active antibiotics response protein n=1 Tax=Paraglaciecola algarum TaxID=3050085 RepID=A0ABS9DC52_9ALTE|nr:LiaF domain-containing protein [Paraglaciecola sp. G1-23]MCF2949937.1 cell wall-active antibiotics response protein [Paraglaciecola sp. G1-23]